MTSKPGSSNEILSKIRDALRQGGLVMKMFSELVVLSQSRNYDLRIM